MKPFVCAGNWKLNKNPQETREFLVQLLETVSSEEQQCFWLFPPTINLVAAADVLKNTSVGWGAQNIYYAESGAFTGETSAAVVASLGATHCLVGHSERRQIFGESDEWAAQKVALLQRLDLVPVLCVGETLEQRQAGETQQVVTNQLAVGLSQADLNKNFVVAYEPVWAIGTGQVATPEQAQEAHMGLRKKLTELGGESLAASVTLLYGGSVKPDNAGALSGQSDIDGFLIGGASLKVDTFVEIFRNSMSQ